ncbi:MAG TPA: hypothetical protein VH186_29700 [Chloroflexia bacterium]|nr:hypothetical protein [Chloroflexia bacterium]
MRSSRIKAGRIKTATGRSIFTRLLLPASIRRAFFFSPYALQTLRALERVVPDTTRQQYVEALYGANEYLWGQLELKNYQLKSCLEEAPCLWRAKVLYTPLRIEEAAILAALR